MVLMSLAVLPTLREDLIPVPHCPRADVQQRRGQADISWGPDAAEGTQINDVLDGVVGGIKRC